MIFSIGTGNPLPNPKSVEADQPQRVLGHNLPMIVIQLAEEPI